MTLPLEDACQGFEVMQRGEMHGKIVFRPQRSEGAV
jgi:hypothetical protein